MEKTNMTGFNSKREAAADKVQEPLIDRLRKTASKGVSVWGDLMLEAADALAQPAQEPTAMQGLAAYLRCEAGGVFVGSPNHETLMQWAREVDAARAQPAQEPVNLLEARKIAADYGTLDSQVDDGNLYFALSKCLKHIDAQPAQERNFCSRCGKRTADLTVIHTCTPPQEKNL